MKSLSNLRIARTLASAILNARSLSQKSWLCRFARSHELSRLVEIFLIEGASAQRTHGRN